MDRTLTGNIAESIKISSMEDPVRLLTNLINSRYKRSVSYLHFGIFILSSVDDYRKLLIS